MYILHPQRSAFEMYCSSRHAKTIKNVCEEYERLEKLTDDTVTWCIIPSAKEPFTVFFGPRDRRLVVLLGFVGGIEYHPIRVMRQFDFRQDAFVDSTAPDLLRLYPLNSTATITELAKLMRFGV